MEKITTVKEEINSIKTKTDNVELGYMIAGLLYLVIVVAVAYALFNCRC